jgi:protein-tyrosine phosphatase
MSTNMDSKRALQQPSTAPTQQSTTNAMVSKSLQRQAHITKLFQDAKTQFVPGYEVNRKLLKFLEEVRFFNDDFNYWFAHLCFEFYKLIPMQDTEVKGRQKIRGKEINIFINDETRGRKPKVVEKPIYDMSVPQETMTFKIEMIEEHINNIANQFHILEDAVAHLKHNTKIKEILGKRKISEQLAAELLQELRKLELPHEYVNYAELNNIPLELMVNVIFPLALFRAMNNKQVYISECYDLLPRLKEYALTRNEQLLRSNGHGFNFSDPRFLTYDANQIRDTHLIAAAGPKDDKQVELFLANTAFHLTQPVKRFAVVGNEFKESVQQGQVFDFVNWFLFEKRKPKQFGRYEIEVMRQGNLKLLPPLGESMSLDAISTTVHLDVKDTVSGDVQEIEVDFFKLKDNDPIILEKKEDFKRLFELYEYCLKQDVVVHCGAGLGRAGHLIFALLFPQLTKHISLQQLTSSSASDVLNRIRHDRPCAIFTELQYAAALEAGINLRSKELGASYEDQLRGSMSLTRSVGSTLMASRTGSTPPLATGRTDSPRTEESGDNAKPPTFTQQPNSKAQVSQASQPTHFGKTTPAPKPDKNGKNLLAGLVNDFHSVKLS